MLRKCQNVWLQRKQVRPYCGSTQFGRVRKRHCDHKTFIGNYVLSNKITTVSHFRCLCIILFGESYFSLQRIFTVFRDGSSAKIFFFLHKINSLVFLFKMEAI